MVNPLELMLVQSRPEYLQASENITQMVAIHALPLGLRNIGCVTFTRTMNLSKVYGHPNSVENKYQTCSHN